MGLRNASNLIALLILSLFVAACGGDEGEFDPNESESSRTIRETVRAEMEVERLNRLAPRLAQVAAAAAGDPTAASVPSDGSTADEGSDASGSSESGGARGSAMYAQNCSSCHGPRGAGDGPVAASLVPQPAKHNDGGYMNALSNDHLLKVIRDGGVAVGKAPTMAPWGATMSDDQIMDVIAFIRSLAEPPYSGTMP